MVDLTKLGELADDAHKEILAAIDAAVAPLHADLNNWITELTARYTSQAVMLNEILQRLKAGDQPPKPLIDPRDVNFPIGIEAVKEWCSKAPGTPAPWGRIYRLAAGVLTESYGGYNLDNEGAAYPDTGVTPWAGTDMPLATRQAARAELRKSTALPHDRHPVLGATKNGASVGWLQQIPLSMTQLLFKANWGYGSSAATSIQECMDVRTSTLMFCDRLQVTNRTTFTASDGTVITGLDPIMADLLSLQNPRADEAKKPEQYGPNMVIKVKHMVDNWGPRYFTDAPQPPILAN